MNYSLTILPSGEFENFNREGGVFSVYRGDSVLFNIPANFDEIHITTGTETTATYTATAATATAIATTSATATATAAVPATSLTIYKDLNCFLPYWHFEWKPKVCGPVILRTCKTYNYLVVHPRISKQLIIQTVLLLSLIHI